MNSGPEEVLDATGAESSVTIVRHWGVQLLNKKGEVFATRWNPGYGSGVYVPYSEAEARSDSGRNELNFPASQKRLVTRTETTVTVTTEWSEPA